MMEWTRGHIIGRGSSSTVYLATTTATTTAAVKSSELSQSQHLQREQKILSTLSSPHIVSYKGFNITKENKSSNEFMYNLFVEYMPFGTLSQATRRNGGRLSEPVIAHYTWQVLKGLEYLHSRGLVHCDIKGSNILVGGKSGSVVKIADFGFCKSVNGDSTGAPVAGTPAFMSPESARGEEQGFACDVWAVGCTVVEMANGGCSPWPNAVDPVTVLYRVGYCGDVPEIPRFLSDEAKDFLGKCFMRNPRERWSVTQLLMHPFLLGFFSSSSSNSKGGDHEDVVLDVDSNSCSPTSILEHGFWNSVEESECPLIGNWFQGKFECSASASDKIKKLALCSGVPSWNLDDQNWITIRGNNEVEIESSSACCIGGSMAASNSVSDDWNDLDELHRRSDVSNFRIRCNFCEDFIKCRDVSIVAGSNLNFVRDIAEMKIPLTLDIL